MLGSCKLFMNHFHSHLLSYSCQVPIHYWQRPNWSFPVDTCFSLSSELLQQQGKGTEAVFQLKPSEMNWSWGHKLPFPEMWQLPTNITNFVFWLLLVAVILPLKGTIWENLEFFRRKVWWAQEHTVESHHGVLFRLSWLIFIFLCVPVTAVANGFSSCRSVIIRKLRHVYRSHS